MALFTIQSKNQAILLPNGMLGSIYTTSIAQNDKGVVNISGIAEELERVLANWKLHNNQLFPALYGDDIYELCSVIEGLSKRKSETL